ncbi:MAG: dTMP kinase [Nitrospirales bacterium]
MGARRAGRQGVFLTLEGVEGSGKSSQGRRLAGALRRAGYPVVQTREPGGTPLAERIRRVVLGEGRGPRPTEAMTPACEALLILACRSQHVTHLVKPALHRGAVVLCDRFTDSTLAYQGFGRGLNLSALSDLNRVATGGLEPDLTLLLDVPAGLGLTRRRRQSHRQGSDGNRLDREARRFHERVRKGFLHLAARFPRRIKVIDGRADPDTVAATMLAVVMEFLTHRTGLRRRVKAGPRRKEVSTRSRRSASPTRLAD